jgi:hypothetical protein
MSPVPTAIRDQRDGRPVVAQVSLPYPTADRLLQLSKEFVVDWQLTSDLERKN